MKIETYVNHISDMVNGTRRELRSSLRLHLAQADLAMPEIPYDITGYALVTRRTSPDEGGERYAEAFLTLFYMGDDKAKDHQDMVAFYIFGDGETGAELYYRTPTCIGKESPIVGDEPTTPSMLYWWKEEKEDDARD